LTGWNSRPWLIGGAGILLTTVLLLGIWILAESLYLRLLPPSKLAHTLFRRLYRYGPRLGMPARIGDTPFEYAIQLERRVMTINPLKFQRVPASLRTLTQFYTRAIFSPQPLKGAEKTQLLGLWPGLRRQLQLARWLYFWRKGIAKP